MWSQKSCKEGKGLISHNKQVRSLLSVWWLIFSVFRLKRSYCSWRTRGKRWLTSGRIDGSGYDSVRLSLCLCVCLHTDTHTDIHWYDVWHLIFKIFFDLTVSHWSELDRSVVLSEWVFVLQLWSSWTETERLLWQMLFRIHQADECLLCHCNSMSFINREDAAVINPLSEVREKLVVFRQISGLTAAVGLIDDSHIKPDPSTDQDQTVSQH